MQFRNFLKPSVFGVVLFLFSLLLLLALHDFLIKKTPDALYYPFAHNFGFFTVSVYFLPIVLFFWGACNGLNYYLRSMKSIVKNLLQVFVFIGVIGLSFFVMLQTMFSGGARFDVGHPFCVDELIEHVERCEGRNYGFMQGRFHGAVMLGKPVPGIEQKVFSVPKYSMQKVSCSNLAVGFGQKCYSGDYFANTGDHYYLNVYLNGKALLVVKTVNAVLDGSSNEYETLFDLKRFESEMRPHEHTRY